MPEKLPKIVVILGPTASGKTDLGIFLAKKFNGEIISADSRQIYKEMDIGTAKPTGVHSCQLPVRSAQRAFIIDGVPHYLIDIIKPDEEFTVADFKKLAEKKIADILKRGKLPIIVGGTGLYIWALVDNLQMPKQSVDAKLREKLNGTPLPKLLEMLKKADAESFARVDLKNPRRVIRALEVALSGEPFWKTRRSGKPIFDALQIGINWPREVLYERINQRVEEQIKDGLLDEVKNLAQKYGWEINAMNGIGYRQFKDYLERKEPLEKAVEKLKQDTRQYAKRQGTWFKRNKRIKWVDGAERNTVVRLTEEFLRN